MTASAATPEQLAGALKIMDLAEEADAERQRWKDDTIRVELRRISVQLTLAGRLALSASEVWAESWADAGRLTLRKYQAQRKLIENLA